MFLFFSLGIIALLGLGTSLSWRRTWPTSGRLPASLPWVGLQKGVFAKTRACLREFAAGLQTLADGYSQFNKHGQPFVILDPGGRPQVMIPQEHVRWLMDQPDGILSERKVQNEKFCIGYLIPPIDHYHESSLMTAVRRELTQNLGKTQADVFTTMRDSIDSTLGLDDASWHEINLYQTMQEVVFKATSRILVGAPLCHDAKYQESISKFSVWLGALAIIIGQYMPWFLTPILGHLAFFPVNMYRKKAMRLLLPVCEERMKSMASATKDVSDEPKDLITWAIQRLDGARTTPTLVADMIISLTLGAVHATIMVSTNVFLDILSCKPESDCYSCLREEAASVFRTPEHWTALSSLSNLPLADSAVRESLRLSPGAGRGAMRQVVAKEGLTLPSGQHLPQNAWVGAYIVGIHLDSRYYQDPNEYQPFRHARKVIVESSSTASSIGKTKLGSNGVYLATTSDTFLGFGYGRHSCSGRWFAAHLLKLMVAYITLHYDIQPLQSRPANQIFGDTLVPSTSTTLKVRRRKLEVAES